jgi:hypothetical protein
MSTTKEKVEVAALVLAFPVLMGLGYLIYQHKQRNKAERKRLAELDEAEREAGCD